MQDCQDCLISVMLCCCVTVSDAIMVMMILTDTTEIGDTPTAGGWSRERDWGTMVCL